jgi:uncharacterized protein YggE
MHPSASIRLAFATFALALTTSACGATAQAETPRSDEAAKRPFPLLTVSGTTELAVAPDEAWVHLGVVSFFSTMESSIEDNDKRIKAILSVVRQGAVGGSPASPGFGIDAADIATTHMNLSETDRYDGPGKQVRGWEVSRSLVVRVRRLDRLETLLQAVINAGATHLRDVHFTHSQLGDKKGEARVAAMKAARDKANAMAAAIGQKVGKAVTVTEQNNGSRVATFSDYSNAVVNAGGTALEGETIAAGRVRVSVAVEIAFELL